MNQKTLDLIKENIKDPTLYDVIYKAVLIQARKTAIVLGSFLVIALITVVYGFVQQTKIETIQGEILQKNEELRLTKLEAEKQASLVIEARLIAKEINKQTAEQLKECQRKK